MAKDTTTNEALWLSSFSSPLELKTLPIPTATSGSVIVRPLAVFIAPYASAVYSGQIPLNLEPPFVPGPGSIARVHEVGSDSVKLKPEQLLFVDSVVRARDDPDIFIMQGHAGGAGEEPHRKLLRQWRDGSLQQLQRVPLENCYVLDEARLTRLGYTPVELIGATVYIMAAGAIIETADVKSGETVVVGPCGGSFGGAAVEIALSLGASVVALGRSEVKLRDMKRKLGDPDLLQIVAMTGDIDRDAAAIREATPDGLGANVLNDWTPGGTPEPLYLAAALQACKNNARVIVSGGATGKVSIPNMALLMKNLRIVGKAVYMPATVRQVLNMVTSGVLKIGKKNGAEVAIYKLEEHREALDNVTRYGGWKNFTGIAPNE